MDTFLSWREQYIEDLDEELMLGGYVISEWCAVVVQECDTAFCAGANLAVVITSVAGIEAYLNAEYPPSRRVGLYNLVEESPISDELKTEIHALRKYRNRWVHIPDPMNDAEILENKEKIYSELQYWSNIAMRTLRKTIYENPFV